MLCSSFLLPSRQEKLGYNLQTSGGPGTPDQYYAMAGCKTPSNITSRGCGAGPKKNTFHASLGQFFSIFFSFPSSNLAIFHV